MYFIIEINSKIEGYFCVGWDNILYEFHINSDISIIANDVFSALLNQGFFLAAHCKSFDHLIMSLCFDNSVSTRPIGYLFRDTIDVEPDNTLSNLIDYRVATTENLWEILNISGSFFENIQRQIEKNDVFVFYANNTLVGIGVIQLIYPGTNYYDLGAIVNENYRRNGYGSYIFKTLLEHCEKNNLIPVCSCSYDNISGKKALERAGFITKHRIIQFQFKR